MSIADIRNLLVTNPNLIKRSLETSMKLQSAIYKYVTESGKKVTCDNASCDGLENVPKGSPVLNEKDYNGKTQYMNITILNEDADDEYIQRIKNRLQAFEHAYINFDSITAEDIINIDNI